MGGGGKGGSKVRVVEYKLSVHAGVCYGPARLRGFYYGEKTAWEGDIAGPSAIVISRPDLHGGELKEGGLVGYANWLPGNEDQVLPLSVTAHFDLTPDTCPAFRGVATMFLNGAYTLNFGGGALVGIFAVAVAFEQLISDIQTGAIYKQGAIIAHNNPYLKTLWLKVTCDAFVTGLPDDLAMIGDDANPSHIIYDCVTNTSWGMGAPASSIDTNSFLEVAQTLFNENFGLSLGWFQQATIEAFISEILDHIQATIFVNPSTGLLTIKLLRGDYVIDDLPLFDESNSTLTEFQRKSWGETVNEIVVTYTDPSNEEEATVSYQELGNIIAQGGVISDSRDYHGVRNPGLAMSLAARDCRTSAAPLASCIIECDRSAWDIVPGSVIRVSNTHHQLNNVVFRVGSVDYGRIGSSKIKLNLLEDIFSFRVGAYIVPPDTLHPGAGETPQPLAYTKLFTMPAFFVANYGGGFPEYPNTYAAIMGTQNGNDTFYYTLYSEQVDIAGNEVYRSLGDRTLNSRTVLQEALPAAAESNVTLASTLLGIGPEINGFIMIGDGGDSETEIAMITDIDSNGLWTIQRGMFDTVPRSWPAGAAVWFISLNTAFGDATPYAPSSTINYKLASKTSQGLLPLEDAAEESVTLDLRPHRPNRPGRVRVNGENGFDQIIDAVDAPEIVVTWANRNRLFEETTVFFWEDNSVTPESGQKTIIRLYDTNDNLVATYDDIDGESQLLEPYDYAGHTIIRVNVKSKVGSDESLQGYDLLVRTGYGGWGLNWGFSWGGG